MTISIVVDRGADAAYIRFARDPIVLAPEVNLDTNRSGVVVGIEVLTLAAQIPYDAHVADHHVEPVVVDGLRRICPGVGNFVTNVQSA